jgi:hypothetical protein
MEVRVRQAVRGGGVSPGGRLMRTVTLEPGVEVRVLVCQGGDSDEELR